MRRRSRRDDVCAAGASEWSEMSTFEPNRVLAEFAIVGILASFVMEGLLVRVIGAPNSFPIAAIALASGVSTAIIVDLLFPSRLR
jgi:hypothetical protein